MVFCFENIVMKQNFILGNILPRIFYHIAYFQSDGKSFGKLSTFIDKN